MEEFSKSSNSLHGCGGGGRLCRGGRGWAILGGAWGEGGEGMTTQSRPEAVGNLEGWASARGEGAWPLWCRAFLSAYALTGSIPEAADACGISRDRVDDMKRSNPSFKAALADARD